MATHPSSVSVSSATDLSTSPTSPTPITATVVSSGGAKPVVAPISPIKFKSLIAKIQENDPAYREISIRDERLSQEQVDTLCDVLGKNRHVVKVSLINVGLGSSTGAALRRMLLAKRDHLVELNLSSNTLGQGINAIAEGLLGNTTLELLSLADNQLNRKLVGPLGRLLRILSENQGFKIILLNANHLEGLPTAYEIIGFCQARVTSEKLRVILNGNRFTNGICSLIKREIQDKPQVALECMEQNKPVWLPKNSAAGVVQPATQGTSLIAESAKPSESGSVLSGAAGSLILAWIPAAEDPNKSLGHSRVADSKLSAERHVNFKDQILVAPPEPCPWEPDEDPTVVLDDVVDTWTMEGNRERLLQKLKSEYEFYAPKLVELKQYAGNEATDSESKERADIDNRIPERLQALEAMLFDLNLPSTGLWNRQIEYNEDQPFLRETIKFIQQFDINLQRGNVTQALQNANDLRARWGEVVTCMRRIMAMDNCEQRQKESLPPIELGVLSLPRPALIFGGGRKPVPAGVSPGVVRASSSGSAASIIEKRTGGAGVITDQEKKTLIDDLESLRLMLSDLQNKRLAEKPELANNTSALCADSVIKPLDEAILELVLLKLAVTALHEGTQKTLTREEAQNYEKHLKSMAAQARVKRKPCLSLGIFAQLQERGLVPPAKRCTI